MASLDKPTSRSIIRSQYRVLDERQRRRRIQEALDFLEKDNLQAEPHADLVMSKKAPKFENQVATQQNRRFRLPRTKTLEQLIDEDTKESPNVNYMTIATRGLLPINGSSLDTVANKRSDMYSANHCITKRNFCSVCGMPKNYECLACGGPLCSGKCKNQHEATRCIKWT